MLFQSLLTQLGLKFWWWNIELYHEGLKPQSILVEMCLQHCVSVQLNKLSTLNYINACSLNFIYLVFFVLAWKLILLYLFSVSTNTWKQHEAFMMPNAPLFSAGFIY